MRKYTGIWGAVGVLLGIALGLTIWAGVRAAELQDLRLGISEKRTRLVYQLDQLASYEIQYDESSLLITFDALSVPAEVVEEFSRNLGGLLGDFSFSEVSGKAVFRLDVAGPFYVRYFDLARPERLVVDLYPKKPKVAAAAPVTKTAPKDKAAAGTDEPAKIAGEKPETPSEQPMAAQSEGLQKKPAEDRQKITEAVTPSGKYPAESRRAVPASRREAISWLYIALPIAIVLLLLIGFLSLRRASRRYARIEDELETDESLSWVEEKFQKLVEAEQTQRIDEMREPEEDIEVEDQEPSEWEEEPAEKVLPPPEPIGEVEEEEISAQAEAEEEIEELEETPQTEEERSEAPDVTASLEPQAEVEEGEAAPEKPEPIDLTEAVEKEEITEEAPPEPGRKWTYIPVKDHMEEPGTELEEEAPPEEELEEPGEAPIEEKITEEPPQPLEKQPMEVSAEEMIEKPIEEFEEEEEAPSELEGEELTEVLEEEEIPEEALPLEPETEELIEVVEEEEIPTAPSREAVHEVLDQAGAVLDFEEGILTWPVHILEGDRAGRIMVVDDEPEVVKALEQLLNQENYDVMGLTDGRSALEKYQDWNPDLVITDVVMPGLSGVDLIHKLKEQNGLRKVIFLSGRTERDSVSQEFEQELAEGRYEFFRKPLSTAQFVGRIRDYFSTAQEILKLNLLNAKKFEAELQHLGPHELVPLEHFICDKIFEISSSLLGRRIEPYYITDRMEPAANYKRRMGCQERDDYCIADVCFASNPHCAANKLRGELEVMRQIIEEFRDEYVGRVSSSLGEEGLRRPARRTRKAAAKAASQTIEEEIGTSPPPRRPLRRLVPTRKR